MKSWLIAFAVALALFLVWGYVSGHCVLCRRLKERLDAEKAAKEAT